MRNIFILFICLFSCTHLQAQLKLPTPSRPVNTTRPRPVQRSRPNPTPVVTEKKITEPVVVVAPDPRASVDVIWEGNGTVIVKVDDRDLTLQSNEKGNINLKIDKALEVSVKLPGKTYYATEFLKIGADGGELKVNTGLENASFSYESSTQKKEREERQAEEQQRIEQEEAERRQREENELQAEAARNAEIQRILTSGIEDIDGNKYKVVKIGNQIWMAENLRVTKYQNGMSISNITDSKQWGNITTGAWCTYNNDMNYSNTYGNLYNWYAVNNKNQLCPTGWHVPSDADWNNLIGHLDPSYNPTARGTQSVAAGSIMKNMGNSRTPGWSGLQGGNRYEEGDFNNISYFGFWWSSTEFSATNAWERHLGSNSGEVLRTPANKSRGFSVRCIRD